MSKLLSEFNVHLGNSYYEMNDYNVFKDKDLLDEFRFRILESISDNNGTGKIETEEILKTIDDVTYGYELSKDERNYLYTLIDNEVNGNGPLTELLNDPLVTEIMVNSPNEVYIEIDGVLKRMKVYHLLIIIIL